MSEKKAKLSRKNQPPERDFTAERDARCNPVVMEIIKCIAEMPQAPLNTEILSKQECFDIYFETNKKVTNIITSHDLDITTDMDHVWQGVMEIVSIVKTVVTNSLKTNEDLMEDALFDIKDGEPKLKSSVKLAKMVSKKDEIREAIKTILNSETTIDQLVK
jgi:hypothetical protein